MGEVLSVEAVQVLQNRDLAYDQIEGAIRSVCASHEELRTRLEEIEWSSGVAEQAARKETERADLLFIEKERLRARLESAEVALRRVHPDFIVIPRRGYVGCRLCFTEAERDEPLRHANFCPFAALGAAGERST